MELLEASVIIPVYNQTESLRVTMEFFRYQTYPSTRYEIIVVDDGSTDLLPTDSAHWPVLPCRVRYIRQDNQGRAVARNTGIAAAEGKRLIFCDADRFPDCDFVTTHVSHGKRNTAIIGTPWDYFGNVRRMMEQIDKNWVEIRRFSRKPLYYTKLLKLYHENGQTDSGIPWASFLVGNSSVNREDMAKVGGFDPEFRTWGFEHFEVAYRLLQIGVRFVSLPEAANFHQPHPREQGYYAEMIQSSIRLLQRKHPDQPWDKFEAFMFGSLSLQEVEQSFSGKVTAPLCQEDPVLFQTR